MQQQAFAYLITWHNQHHRKSLAICLVIVSYTKVVFNFSADNKVYRKVVFNFSADNKVYRKCKSSYCKL